MRLLLVSACRLKGSAGLEVVSERRSLRRSYAVVPWERDYLKGAFVNTFCKQLDVTFCVTSW